MVGKDGCLRDFGRVHREGLLRHWFQPVCSQSGVEVVELDSEGVRDSGKGGKWQGLGSVGKRGRRVMGSPV